MSATPQESAGRAVLLVPEIDLAVAAVVREVPLVLDVPAVRRVRQVRVPAVPVVAAQTAVHPRPVLRRMPARRAKTAATVLAVRVPARAVRRAVLVPLAAVAAVVPEGPPHKPAVQAVCKRMQAVWVSPAAVVVVVVRLRPDHPAVPAARALRRAAAVVVVARVRPQVRPPAARAHAVKSGFNG